MRSRGKVEGLVKDLSGQSPSFQDEKFIEQLLQLIADNDDVSLTTLIAMTLGAESYHIDLKHQIIVDFRLDFLRFCANQNFFPSKIIHLMKWMTDFQQIVENDCSVDKMRNELIEFAASEIEEGWKWKSKQAAALDEAAVESQISSKASNKKGTRVIEKVAVEEVDNAAALPRECIYLTKEDIGSLCTYLLHGIIQHASLYFYVANYSRENGTPRELRFFLELPTPAPPLRFALSKDKSADDASQISLQQLREQRNAELTTLVDECKEVISKEELWRKTKETEKAMQILIDNEGTKKAVENTYESMEFDLSQRQKRILQRITALEKLLGVESLS
ncbi:uncharacterized protein TM35_000401150 [Trypanosoma theileri]|uniref:Uncharacterized protein n=1 Tax=Trypanosoma theileri TaxID=67003 RepID=A0A1X0NK11_9TRYP|nr:uncharacterized protein TM35_000401150 [Trypanosoma theileri]ORC84848.1 hypothetical protein TM35_000401150 [Trypanosoma theileri]